ncbi:hypothetical protein PORCAN_542 [Porphyromonas crevioricanis JCM 13913]|nr:hypothetical protein PORCAN_542 [Porphyromonas crevioricanis JCM 13913]
MKSLFLWREAILHIFRVGFNSQNAVIVLVKERKINFEDTSKEPMNRVF